MAKSRKTELDVDVVEAIPEAPEPIPEIPEEVEEKKEVKVKKTLLTPKLKKILLFSAIGFLVLLIVGIALIFLLVSPPEKKEEVIVEKVIQESPGVSIAQLSLFFLPMSEKKEEKRFVRIGVSMELSSQGLIREIDRNLVMLREDIYMLFKEGNKKWVRSPGKRKKKGIELKNLVNMSLQTGTVKAVYFYELVIM